MQRQRLKEALAHCEGLSFAEVATYIDKFPYRVTALHVSAVALAKNPEYEIGGKSIEYIKKALYPAPDGKIPVAPAKNEPGDEQNKPLKKYCDERWLAVRGCKLTSATNKKDGNQFATMLKRTCNDEAIKILTFRSLPCAS